MAPNRQQSLADSRNCLLAIIATVTIASECVSMRVCVYGCRNADLCLSLIINGEEGLQRRRLIYRKKRSTWWKPLQGRETGLHFCAQTTLTFSQVLQCSNKETLSIEAHQWTHWKGCLLIRPKLCKLLKRECAFICKRTVWTGYTNVAIEPTTFL